jgi:uncharacterized lipoprotein YmbA
VKRILPAALVILLVAACAHSPVAREHSLFPALGERLADTASTSATTTILLASCTVPESVDRPQWVVNAPDGTVRVLPGERWIEPLKLAVARTIAHEVQSALPGTVAWAATSAAGPVRADVRLHVEVAAWEAVPGQYARVDLAWQIDHARTRHAGRGAFVLPLADASPATLLRAQREALARGSARIADDIRVVLQKHQS